MLFHRLSRRSVTNPMMFIAPRKDHFVLMLGLILMAFYWRIFSPHLVSITMDQSAMKKHLNGNLSIKRRTKTLLLCLFRLRHLMFLTRAYHTAPLFLMGLFQLTVPIRCSHFTNLYLNVKVQLNRHRHRHYHQGKSRHHHVKYRHEITTQSIREKR